MRQWLLKEKPTVEQVVYRLKEVRGLAKQCALVEVWLIAYGMEAMDLDYQLDAVPEIFQEKDLIDD